MKIRAPRVHVPSLMLWTKVLDATREMTLWERIRKAVSLDRHHGHRRSCSCWR